MPRALGETPDRGRPTDAFCRHRLAPQALAHRRHRRGGRAAAVAADRQRPADVPGAVGERRRVLESVGECRVALEATYGWEWLADVLQDAGYELHLAHPMRTKAIASARVKTDAVDA